MRIRDWSSDVCSSDLLNMVAGGVVLKPRVIEDATAAAAIGKRPVGLPDHFINLNPNWRTPIAKGLSFDLAGVHRGKTPATTDNALYVPPRTPVHPGARSLFKLGRASCRERVCQYGSIQVVAVHLKKKNICKNKI